jgi:pimeloyl-ACP methyl ester carboxylesterase
MKRLFLGLTLVLVALIAAGFLVLRRGDIPYETLEAQYAQPASQYLEIGDLRVHYTDEGPRDGKVVVLVHGFSASSHTWQAWTDRLVDDYRVIRLDLPGHGLTRAPEGYLPTIEGYAAVVEALAERVGLDRFAIAGSSMGGNVAWVYAETYPERLDGLVLVASSGWPSPEEAAGEDNSPAIFGLLRTPIIGNALLSLDSTALTRQGLQASFFDPAFAADAMVTRYVSLARAPGHRQILFQIINDFANRPMASPVRMAAITLPVLVMQGDSDNLVSPEGGRLFAEHLPDARLKWYENVGHIPQEEIAEQSAADLKAFLQEVWPPLDAPLTGEAAPAPESEDLLEMESP